MTVASETRRNEYTGDGATATYAYGFAIQAASHLRVTRRNPSGSPAQVYTTLVLTTDYTVSGVGDPAGGTITLVAGNLTSGWQLIIERVVPLTQDTDIRNQGPFLPEIHEDALDLAAMADQQIRDDERVRSGTIVLWPTANPPRPGYLLCNGDEVSRTEYATLFALISTTFGVGDGSTTFELPTIADVVTNVRYAIKT